MDFDAAAVAAGAAAAVLAVVAWAVDPIAAVIAAAPAEA